MACIHKERRWLAIESYCVPASTAEATIVEKKSEFIGHLSPVETEEQALDFLEKIRAAHRTASHNVYAYQLRSNARQRYSDDGEPAKTAGLPVLNAITYAGLTDTIIVVTRYFGGTLLGTGGLVRAYTAAAGAVIEKAGIATIRSVLTVEVSLPYALYEQACRLIDETGARMLKDAVFAADVFIAATLPEANAPVLQQKLTELLRSPDHITTSKPFYMPW